MSVGVPSSGGVGSGGEHVHNGGRQARGKKER